MNKILINLLSLCTLILGACTTNKSSYTPPSFYINEAGELVQVNADGTEIILGTVKGEQGEQGPQGEPGKDGKDGEDGKDGADGKDGQDGKDGKDGRDGVDGKDGQDGKDGTDGKDGKDGADGQDGKDGEVIIVEHYNDYWEQLCDALRNATYCDSPGFARETGREYKYLAVYVQGESGTKNAVVGYHSAGATESFAHIWGDEYGVQWKNTHTQYCCIKREDNINYEDYLPKPFNTGYSFYHNEYHYVEYYEPSEQYEHTLEGMGLHILVDTKIECSSTNTAISYNGVPVKRIVISYKNDFWIGTPDGILEEIRLGNV